jgi:hypothetical protein
MAFPGPVKSPIIKTSSGSLEPAVDEPVVALPVEAPPVEADVLESSLLPQPAPSAPSAQAARPSARNLNLRTDFLSSWCAAADSPPGIAAAIGDPPRRPYYRSFDIASRNRRRVIPAVPTDRLVVSHPAAPPA